MIATAIFSSLGAAGHAALSVVLCVLPWAPVLLQADALPSGEPAVTGTTQSERIEYHYTKPFLQPLPVWDDGQWPWLLVPLCVGVAVVYKSIKCRYVRQIPREAGVLSVWILLGMTAAAAVLAVIVKWLERGA